MIQKLKIKSFFLTICILFSLAGCEKDDICEEGTPTTPKMVIAFFDKDNPSLSKNVSGLRITASDYIDEDPTNSLGPFSGVSQIEIPLKVNENTTGYHFTINEGNPDENLIATDIVQFFYERNDVFISRACGFKTLFELNQDIPVIYENSWIDQINIIQYMINNEDEVHVHIFF